MEFICTAANSDQLLANNEWILCAIVPREGLSALFEAVMLSLILFQTNRKWNAEIRQSSIESLGTAARDEY